MKKTRVLQNLRRTALVIATISALGTTLPCVAANVSDSLRAAYADRVNFDVVAAGERYDSFIVYYNDPAVEKVHEDTTDTRLRLERDLSRVSAAFGTTVVYERPLATGGYLVRLARGTVADDDAERFMIEFAKNPDVAKIEPNGRAYPLFVPNDTRYGEQWSLFDLTGGANVPSAWDLATGSGAVVAVIDTGITPHTDMAGQVIGGYDFISTPDNARDGNGRDANPNDEGDWHAASTCYNGQPAANSSWHGTHVAGTIAAVTNNAKGVAGVAHTAKIVPVRVLGRCGGTDADISDAMVWASGGTVPGVPANPNPANVINMSLGALGACGTTYQTAITMARSRNTVVVVAAGNSNINVSGARPASCSGVVAVAATTKAGGRAGYSNYGALIDISAPGGDGSQGPGDILSTLNAGATTQGSEIYKVYAGTSMAAPHVSGLAGLILSKNGSLSPDQVEAVIKKNARPLPGACSGGCGAGIIDAKKTLDNVVNTGGGLLTSGVWNFGDGAGLSAAVGSSLIYTLEAPFGAYSLTVTTLGGNGNADLYVKFGSEPTTALYECRGIKTNNDEFCEIPNPQWGGKYYVLVYAKTAFSGLSLKANSYADYQEVFNTMNFLIPDSGNVTSTITVNNVGGNAPAQLPVPVHIVHTNPGDLQIDLVLPNGVSKRLKDAGPDNGVDNIDTVYMVDASTAPAKGTWKLKVTDMNAGATGYINDWSVKLSD